MSASIPSPGGDAHNTVQIPVDAHADRVRGSVLAGAVGDAFGYVVEFDHWPVIVDRFGVDGLADPGANDGPLVVSDDTQLTLFTLEGLTEALRWANEGSAADELACLWLAYLRWYRTQGGRLPASAPQPPPTDLELDPAMRHRRAPGNACLSGLATGEMATAERPVNPDSKGCGTVMRSAPFGLVPHVPLEAVAELAARASALTHGHPTAGAAAAAFAGIVGRTARGSDLSSAVADTTDGLTGDGDAEVRDALRAAVDAAAADRERAGAGVVVPLEPVALTARLGEGWVAEEALAIAVYCALVDADDDPREHFRRALRRAANHDGDSDSTAAIAGNLVGALHGTAALDPAWVDCVLERDVVDRVVDAFLGAVAGDR